MCLMWPGKKPQSWASNSMPLQPLGYPNGSCICTIWILSLLSFQNVNRQHEHGEMIHTDLWRPPCASTADNWPLHLLQAPMCVPNVLVVTYSCPQVVTGLTAAAPGFERKCVLQPYHTAMISLVLRLQNWWEFDFIFFTTGLKLESTVRANF